MSKDQSLNAVVSAAINEAKLKGDHDDERVLLLLTEIDPNSGYGYEPCHISEPHTVDARLLFPMGFNEKGQRQFLISFDPTNSDDKSHPCLGVPAGWDWQIYGEEETAEPKQEDSDSRIAIVIVLTRLAELPTQTVNKDSPTEITGFTLVKMPQIAHLGREIEQYAIMIDQEQFSVQIRTNQA